MRNQCRQKRSIPRAEFWSFPTFRDGKDEEELVKEAEKEQPTWCPGRHSKKIFPGRNNELWQMLLIGSGKIRTGSDR